MNASSRPALDSHDYALYATTVFAWGFSWIAMRYQVGTVAPEVSVVWRFVLAAPVMLAFAAYRGERLRYPVADHLRFVALGAALFCTNFTLFYYGAERLTSGLLSVVFSLASIINLGLGAIILSAPIDRRVFVGGLLGLIGIAAMFYPELARVEVGSRALVGLAFCVGGTFSFCCGNMISAILQRRAISVVAASAWGMLYGCGLLALFATLRGLPFTVEWTLTYTGALIYLSLIGSVVAFACYLTLLGRIGADRAGYSTVLFPIVALLVSTVVENYQWTLPAVLGLLAVMAGNVLVLRAPRRAIPRPE